MAVLPAVTALSGSEEENISPCLFLDCFNQRCNQKRLSSCLQSSTCIRNAYALEEDAPVRKRPAAVERPEGEAPAKKPKAEAKGKAKSLPKKKSEPTGKSKAKAEPKKKAETAESEEPKAKAKSLPKTKAKVTPKKEPAPVEPEGGNSLAEGGGSSSAPAPSVMKRPSALRRPSGRKA